MFFFLLKRAFWGAQKCPLLFTTTILGDVPSPTHHLRVILPYFSPPFRGIPHQPAVGTLRLENEFPFGRPPVRCYVSFGECTHPIAILASKTERRFSWSGSRPSGRSMGQSLALLLGPNLSRVGKNLFFEKERRVVKRINDIMTLLERAWKCFNPCEKSAHQIGSFPKVRVKIKKIEITT